MEFGNNFQMKLWISSLFDLYSDDLVILVHFIPALIAYIAHFLFLWQLVFVQFLLEQAG